MDREKRLAILGAELREPVADDVHDRAWRQRTVEAAAHTDIECQVVALARKTPRDTRSPSPPSRRQ